MSKIHEAIEKAAAEARQAKSIRTRAGNVASKARSVAQEASGLFRRFQIAKTNKSVMEQSRFVSEIDDRSAIAAYKVLRTRVLQRMRSNNWNSLLVTSAGAGEGKTITASNLALSIAADINQSVMLVDLDLQRSRVAEYFGFDIDINKGVADYLNGNAEISDIVYTPEDMPRFSIIPNQGTIENSSDLLSNPRMQDLLAWIQGQSEDAIIIFDMPPVLVGDDVLAFSPLVDAVLFVVTQGQTERTSLEQAMSLLAETDLLGVTLNKCNERSGENAYGYY